MLKTFEAGSPQHAASALRRAARLVAEYGPPGSTKARVLADLHEQQKAVLTHRDGTDHADAPTAG